MNRTIEEKLSFFKEELSRVSKEDSYEKVKKHIPELSLDILKQQIDDRLELIKVQTDTTLALMTEHFVHGVPMETIKEVYISTHNTKNIPLSNKYALNFMCIS